MPLRHGPQPEFSRMRTYRTFPHFRELRGVRVRNYQTSFGVSSCIDIHVLALHPRTNSRVPIPPIRQRQRRFGPSGDGTVCGECPVLSPFDDRGSDPHKAGLRFPWIVQIDRFCSLGTGSCVKYQHHPNQRVFRHCPSIATGPYPPHPRIGCRLN